MFCQLHECMFSYKLFILFPYDLFIRIVRWRVMRMKQVMLVAFMFYISESSNTNRSELI